MPGSTGLDVDLATVLKLAEHANIVGIKDSSGNVGKIGAIAREVGPGFSVIVGSGGSFYPALCVGASGTVAALANLRPGAMRKLYQHFLDGQHKQARQLQLDLIPVNTAVTARWGVPGLKAALDLEGIYYGGPPRAPRPGERTELARAIADR